MFNTNLKDVVMVSDAFDISKFKEKTNGRYVFTSGYEFRITPAYVEAEMSQTGSHYKYFGLGSPNYKDFKELADIIDANVQFNGFINIADMHTLEVKYSLLAIKPLGGVPINITNMTGSPITIANTGASNTNINLPNGWTVGVDLSKKPDWSKEYESANTNPLYCSCLKPMVVQSEAAGKKFDYCRGCKKEKV